MMTTWFENGSRIGEIAHLHIAVTTITKNCQCLCAFKQEKNETHGLETSSLGRPESNNVFLALGPSNMGLIKNIE